MLTKVVLEGKLRRVVGHPHLMLEFSTVSEMFNLITANFPHLRNWFRKNIKNYEVCRVECEYESGQKECIDDSGLQLERQCKTVRIAPIFTGAGGKNGMLQTIIGAIVTVIGIICCCLPGGQFIGAGLIGAGLGMLLGGIMTMLMSPSNEKDEDKKTSYYFNGAVNTTKQGMPVPLVFGRTKVGSAVISASIDVTTDDRPEGKHHWDDGGK